MGSVVDRIGGHRVVTRLEGYGREVFLTERNDGTSALIALYQLSEETAEEPENAAAACLSVSNRHLSPVVELFPFEGHRAVVFDDVRGMSLSHVVEHLHSNGEQLSDGAVFQVGLGMCRGLAAAHMAQDEDGKVVPLVHSQLGPHQVFIAFDGAVRILSMGLGPIFKLKTDVATLPEAALKHAAPEVKRGNPVMARANTFSAASILWAVLTRQDPPQRALYPKLEELRPDIDTTVARTIDKALEPAVLRRTVTCRQLAEAIDNSGMADQKELLWNIEILRRAPELRKSLIPLESLPPTSEPDGDLFLTSPDDDEVDSQDEMPTGVFYGAQRDDDADVDELWGESEVVFDKVRVTSKIGEPSPPAGPARPGAMPSVKKKHTSVTQVSAVSDEPRLTKSSVGSVPKGQTKGSGERRPRVLDRKPVPLKRPPMLTIQGMGQDVPHTSSMETQRAPDAASATPLGGRTRSEINRPMSRRDEMAKRDTMRLSSNVGGQTEPANLTAKLKAPKVPQLGFGTGPERAPPLGKPIRQVDDGAHEPSAVEHVGPAQPEESAEGPDDDDGRPTNRLPDALPNMPVVTVPRDKPPVIPIGLELGLPRSALPRSAPVIAPRIVNLPAASVPRHPVSPGRPSGTRRANTSPWAMLLVVAGVALGGLVLGVLFGKSFASAPAPPVSIQPTQLATTPAQPATQATSVTPAVVPPKPAPKPTVAKPDPAAAILEIETTLDDAHLYLDGDYVGPLKKTMSVPCGVHNVRLGDYPLTRWTSKGRSFHLRCGKSLELTLEPYYAGPRLQR